MAPSIRPAIMDSHGKPGIAGSTIGVETAIVELATVVGMIAGVMVGTDVLTTVLVIGLVVIAGGSVVALEDMTIELAALELVALDVTALEVTDCEALGVLLLCDVL